MTGASGNALRASSNISCLAITNAIANDSISTPLLKDCSFTGTVTHLPVPVKKNFAAAGLARLLLAARSVN
jgi:hypothetical protein